jgi:hypothetical protein
VPKKGLDIEWKLLTDAELDQLVEELKAYKAELERQAEERRAEICRRFGLEPPEQAQEHTEEEKHTAEIKRRFHLGGGE